MRWRLFIEEYSPDLRYIKGEKNVVADALSWLPKNTDPLDDSLEAFYSTMDCFANAGIMEPENFDFHPLSFENIDKTQQEDPAIKKELQKMRANIIYQAFIGGLLDPLCATKIKL